MAPPVTHDPHAVLPSTLAFTGKNHGSLWETWGNSRGNFKKFQKIFKKISKEIGDPWAGPRVPKTRRIRTYFVLWTDMSPMVPSMLATDCSLRSYAPSNVVTENQVTLDQTDLDFHHQSQHSTISETPGILCMT